MPIIYYDIFCEKISKNQKIETMIVTSKDYWDKETCIDDGGSGQRYNALDKALCQIGCLETCESEYELNISESKMIAEMRKLGYDMQRNEDFTAFLKDCSQEGC